MPLQVLVEHWLEGRRVLPGGLERGIEPSVRHQPELGRRRVPVLLERPGPSR